MAKKKSSSSGNNFQAFVWEGKAEERFLDGVQGLPETMQELARLLPNCDPLESRKLKAISRTPKDQALQQLYEFSNDELLQLMAAFVPNLASEILRAWSLVGRLRVSRGSTCCFQYPPDHTLVRASQAKWLIDLIHAVSKVRPEVLSLEWLAVWGAYLDDTNAAGLLAMLGLSQFSGSGQHAVGVLLASCLSSRSKASENVLDTLKLIAQGRHPIGGFGGQVTAGLLLSENREAQEFVLNLLETSDDAGLLSSITKAAKTARVDMLHEVLGAIVRKDHWKLPSVRTAIAGWLSLNEESVEKDEFGHVLGWLNSLIGDEGLLAIEWQSKGMEAPIWLLWAEGIRDVGRMIECATGLLESGSAETRKAVAGMLRHVGNPDASSAWLRLLSDSDPEVVLWAANWPDADVLPDDPAERLAIRNQLASLHKRLRKAKAKLKSQFGDDDELEDIVGEFEDLVPVYMLDASIEELLPYCDGSNGFKVFTHRINPLPVETVEQREILFRLIDLSKECTAANSIQEVVVKKLVQSSLETSELARLEKQWLASEYSPVRNAMSEGLFATKDELLLSAVIWLLESKKQRLRARGLEFLQNMVDTKRRVQWVKSQLLRYQARFPVPSSLEKTQVQKLLADTKKIEPEEGNPTGASAKGLPSTQSATSSIAQFPAEHGSGAWLRARNGALDAKPKLWPQPAPAKIEIATNAVQRLVAMLLKLAENGATREELLAATQKRPKACRDSDGCELARLFWYCRETPSERFVQWMESSRARKDWLALVCFVPAPNRDETFRLAEFVNFYLWPEAPAFHLDYVSAVFASIPAEDIANLAYEDWRENNDHASPRRMREFLFNRFDSLNLESVLLDGDLLFSRYWKLCSWIDYPIEDAKLPHRNSDGVLHAFGLGIANDGDLYEQLLPKYRSLSVLERPTQISRLGDKAIEDYRSAVSRLIHDLIADEFTRESDTMGLYTEKVYDIEAFVGLDYLVAFLTELTSMQITNKGGSASCFAKPGGNTKTRLSRISARTHLVRATFPRQVFLGPGARKGDSNLSTPPKAELDAFTQRLKPLRDANLLTDQRLVELACMAPQWAWHVEHLLDSKGIGEAVLWFHSCALTDALNLVLECDGYVQKAESEYEQIEKRTPGKKTEDRWSRHETIKGMALDNLVMGLCGKKTQSKLNEFDMTEYFVPEPTKLEWGRSIRSKLGDERWQQFSDAVVYAKGAGELSFLLQKISGKPEEVASEKLPSIGKVLEDIEVKHRKAALEYVGQIPLAIGKAREADLVSRVSALASYRRFYSPKVGGMYGFSAEEAIELVDMAFKSLGALAGIEDHRMLYWLAGNSLPERIASHASFEKAGCRVVLELDACGAPVLRVWDKGKLMRSAPTKFKTDPKLQRLQALKEECKMLHAASRDYLESAMISGETFTTKGFVPYLKNPIVEQMLEQIVMVIAAPTKRNQKPTLGYLKLGKLPTLLDCRGNSVPIESSTEFRVAHPVDFFASGRWLEWKCFMVEEQRPEVFRQVTRELFTPTTAERDRVAPKAENPFDISDESTMKKWGETFGLKRFSKYPVVQDQFEAILCKFGWHKLWSDYFESQWGTIRAIAAMCTSDDENTVCSTLVFFETDADASDYRLISIDSVPARTFSEALRQINTAVRGATPKEAKSQSKSAIASVSVPEDVIALRMQLLQEQMEERNLQNITLAGSLATIVGKLDTYVLDIISGETNRKSKKLFHATPKIVPPADPRFLTIDKELPNATYIVSLAIHLANDDKIREPALIDQLR